MIHSIELKAGDFKPLTSLWGSKFSGHRPVPKLFPMDRREYSRRYQELFGIKEGKSSKHPMATIRKHIEDYFPNNYMGDFVCALTALYRYSKGLFPGYIFLVEEIVNTEWQNLLSLNREHYRDHLVHQAYVTVTAYKLLTKLHISPSNSYLARECADELAKFSSYSYLIKDIPLIDLAAFQLLKADKHTGFFQEIARKCAIHPGFTDPTHSFCVAFNFWKSVVYDTVLTAALYHDIGYTVAFVNQRTRDLNKRIQEELVGMPYKQKVLDDFGTRSILGMFKETFNRGLLYPCDIPSYREEVIIKESLKPALLEGHGLASAILYLMLNDQFRDMQSRHVSKRGLLIMEMAAVAMVRHDLKEIYWGNIKEKNGKIRSIPERQYLRLSFRSDPVSFILSLADEIQSYGRVKKVPKPSKNSNLQFDYDVDRVQLVLNNDGKLLIRQFYTPGVNKPINTHPNDIDREMNFNRKDGYLDYSGILSAIEIEDINNKE